MARQRRTRTEAHRLIRQHLSTPDGAWSPTRIFGPSTPTEELHGFDDQYPSPAEYRGGVLGWILRLYHSRSRQNSIFSGSSGLTTPADSPPASGASTPTWFSSANKSWSSSSLAGLLGNAASFGEKSSPRFKHHGEKKGRQRSYSATALATMQRVLRVKNARQIEQNIAETISCQKFLVRLCRALMLFGAPTHRLEENMQTCARMLSIQAQFLYIPGSMIVAFDDLKTHTSDVRLVRVEQGLDLGKLRDVHEIYKQVIHKHISVDPAIARLEDVVNRESKHSRWFRIVVFGLAAMSVGPFAFGARIIDLPVAFVLGCILGFLQLVMSPQSKLYANVFEIAATVITSFLSRAFGSIRDVNGKYMFCFAALSQSSIALILPGYIVLCASLELQSRSMIAGSIRMVYAIIYSLFLGFGITIGSTLYGIMDTNATSATTCESPMKEPYFFAFVPLFTLCLIIINQAKWKQAPIMLIIAIAGYLANYYSSKKFTGNTQISNTIGALVIGLMANLYSRVGASMENRLINLWERISPLSYTLKRMEEGRPRVSNRRVGYGLAAAAMLPAIWVQVPSGIAVNGSLISSIASADQITGTAQNGTTVANNSTMMAAASPLNTIAFTVGYSVIQVAIGITVGLFLSAIAVYPLGKRQSGLFSL
ncbi:DUF1212-domain-containing protein [Piedraia hortae CBS 480.64]|uniref:DUF1212-domain-containing protein n=1 Tax=Piedraia hortae CBS 480.64 TaxID=1314780 RepID=A0A6A7BT89_9PEZI|nr:DUF1212-domain-containing protein [Piedraia hortae CBS 480.64]